MLRRVDVLVTTVMKLGIYEIRARVAYLPVDDR
jgi:hypothetical protein